MKLTSILSVAATFCFAIASVGCGSPANNAANTSTNINKTNTAVVTNTTTTNTAANTASNTETSKADSVGVPECDDGVPCTFDGCESGVCVYTPMTSMCAERMSMLSDIGSPGRDSGMLIVSGCICAGAARCA